MIARSWRWLTGRLVRTSEWIFRHSTGSIWLRNIEKTSSLYLELAEVQLQVLSCDNCTEVANPNQIDTDDDGEGNLCDMDDDDADNDETPDDADCLVGGEHSAASTVIAEDGDCDGHLNGDDKCPNKSHHDNSDFDDDGVGNVCDGDWDGDGVDNELECAPWDFAVTTLIVDDEDCDGVLNADDCLVDGSHRDDSTIRVEDADCDGVVTDEDCDDGEPGSTTKLGDPDCDGRCSAFLHWVAPKRPISRERSWPGMRPLGDPIFSRAYGSDVETFGVRPKMPPGRRFDLSEPRYVGRIGVTSIHPYLSGFLEISVCPTTEYTDKDLLLVHVVENVVSWDGMKWFEFEAVWGQSVWLRNINEGLAPRLGCGSYIYIYEASIMYDITDNCEVANDDQADVDGDGLGDACDEDMDNDGVTNDLECAPKDDAAAPLVVDDMIATVSECRRLFGRRHPQR